MELAISIRANQCSGRLAAFHGMAVPVVVIDSDYEGRGVTFQDRRLGKFETELV